MSFSFYIPAAEAPTYGDLLAGMPFSDLVCIEDEDDEFDADEPIAADFKLHFFREGVSIRPIEASWDDDRCEVRIMSFSAPSEYELALALVEHLAESNGAEVSPEDAEPMSVEQFRDSYGEAWAADQVSSLFDMLPALVRREESAAQVPGAHRPVYFGKRLMAELEAAGPPEELTERIMTFMRQVQYDYEDEYFAANAMQLRKNDDPDVTFTLAVWGPGVSYLFPDVDYLAMHTPTGGETFFIPYKQVFAVAGERCRWLDETQTLVEATPEEDWPALLARARQFAVEPGKKD